MSFIDEVRAKRRNLAEVLADEEYSGIREIVEELYPDRAHFIYELLQNAEDAGAKEASFCLQADKLIFEHDGKPFSKNDVWGITNIGKGTKRKDDDKIGRFGVGFKAVFAYSETPRIWSPTFNFEISSLVLPRELSKVEDVAESTRFEFPFNNPKKTRKNAYTEVLSGLDELSETTLLFLSSLESISWSYGGQASQILRVPYSENHVEVLKEANGKTKSSSHFLRFSQPVEGLKKQRVAIAFAMEFLPKAKKFAANKSIAKQFKIAPAAPGKVAVFFPAEKETSGLRFHLHAPFIPELSRASIKDTPSNTPLLEQLADLSRKSLHTIKNLGLLTTEFLGVLPNPEDPLPEKYGGIREAIISEMKEEALTPTYAKSFAPASQLIQGKAPLKELLSAQDLQCLIDHESETPDWAVGATQRNSNVDRFLSGLGIETWGFEDLVEILQSIGDGWDDRGERAQEWISGKSPEWHQLLYATLFGEYSPEEDWYHFTDCRIIRLGDGEYDIPANSYFPDSDLLQDDELRRVDSRILSEGKKKKLQKNARKFLEAIGVREVGELEQVESLLKLHYSDDSYDIDFKKHVAHLRRFANLVESSPESAKIFSEYRIFRRSDDLWSPPDGVFLDLPFKNTGLKHFYAKIAPGGDDEATTGSSFLSTRVTFDYEDKAALSSSYERCGVSLQKIARFATAVGALQELEIAEVSCDENPNADYLWSVAGARYTSTGRDNDFTIHGLEQALQEPSIEMSKLVWDRMCAESGEEWFLEAEYRMNSSYRSRYANSQLVEILKNAAWVPQEGGGFVCPRDAAQEQLPRGFPYDAGYTWLEKVEFGLSSKERVERNEERERQARAIGFGDRETLDRAKTFAALPVQTQQEFLSKFSPSATREFPEHSSKNRQRRDDRIEEHARKAPRRAFEKRARSVSTTRETVKAETKEYLIEQYDRDGVLFCQICKAPMPFKLDDGAYYMEKVEFLPSLKHRHYQNYLCLCPNHAVMFKLANGSTETLIGSLLELGPGELELAVILAKENMTIKFTETHIADLETVLQVDGEGGEQ